MCDYLVCTFFLLNISAACFEKLVRHMFDSELGYDECITTFYWLPNIV